MNCPRAIGTGEQHSKTSMEGVKTSCYDRPTTLLNLKAMAYLLSYSQNPGYEAAKTTSQRYETGEVSPRELGA